MDKLFFFIFLLDMDLIQSGLTINFTSQKLLYEKLLRNHDKRILPKCSNNPLYVKIQLAPREIVNVFESQEIAMFQLWVRLSWSDCTLAWNQSEFENISTLIVPNEDIWIPDLTLLESVDFVANMPKMKQFRAKVTSNGSVYFNFLTVVNTLCAMNLTYYPYDVQMCGFTFTSWVYTSKDVHITATNGFGDLTHFSPHQEYIVTEVTSTSVNTYFPCCGGNFSQVSFIIKMKRRPAFFMVTVVLPFFILTVLSIAGFALPSTSGEKITFHITILLATVVFLLQVQDQFPSTSETFPKIAFYFTIGMIFNCVSCVMSAIVMYIYYNDLSGIKMKEWVKKVVINWMGKLLLVKRINTPLNAKTSQHDDIFQRRPNASMKEFLKSRDSRKSIKDMTGASYCISESRSQEPIQNRLQRERGQDCLQIDDSVYNRKPINISCSTDRSVSISYNERINDWELLAYTLDRLFSVFSVSMTVLNSVVFLIIMKSYEANQ